MALTPYHNIIGIAPVTLIAPGDGVKNIDSVSISNIHEKYGVIVDLYVGTNSTSGSAAKLYYLMKGKYLQPGDNIVVNHKGLKFNNTMVSDYGLFIKLGSYSDDAASNCKVDVLISRG